MTEYDIIEGDIVIIDYITQFTHENVYEGKALVIWKGYHGQPLIMRLNKEGLCLTWSCYEYFTKVIGHIDLSSNLKELCKQALDAEKLGTCKGCLEPCIMYEPDMRACKKKVKEVSE